MCRKSFAAAFAAALWIASYASAQTLLDRVEGTLKAKSAPAAAAPAAAAPAAETPKPYLGFVPNETINDGKGVRVDGVTKGGPAETGGLKAGDLITAIDGKPVKNLDDFDAIYATTTVGQKLRVTVERALKPQSLTITLAKRPAAAAVGDEPGEAPPAEPPLTLTDPAATTPKPALDPLAKPADPLATPADPLATTPKPSAPIRSKPAATKPLDLGAPPADPATPPATLDPLASPVPPVPAETTPPATLGGRPSLGITVVPLTDEARATYGLSVRRGALITNVRPGSPADTAGLPIGGVVVALDGKKIDTAEDLVGMIRAGRVGDEIELTYYEGPNLARKSLRLAPAASGIVASPGAIPPGVGPPSSTAPRATAPLDLNLGGSDRPLLNKVEQLVEGFTSPRTAPGALPRGPSTVYDPSEMAALRNQVLSLEEKVTALEDRIKLLEAKLGTSTPAANP
jgi:membrane-associated protease RseP (regulator of RpoE activity)